MAAFNDAIRFVNIKSITQKYLLIRVLVSPQIGLGHVARCKGLAAVLAANGWSIVWILNKESTGYFHKLALPGSVAIVPDTLFFLSEAPVWSALMTQASEKCVVLLDGYRFDDTYLSALRNLNIPLVIFDDSMLQDVRGADILINSSIVARESDYLGRGVKKLLLGPRFAPVRLEFLNKEKRPLSARSDFLVMFGGSDILGLSQQFVSALTKVGWTAEIPIVLVTGAAYANVEKLEHYLAEMQLPVSYRHNVQNMAELMSNARLALSAAGSTLFELAVMGVPSISLIVADNQERTAWEMHHRKWCVTFDARHSLDWQTVLMQCRSLWATAFSEVSPLSDDVEHWCDGLGLIRIAEAIEQL